MRISRNATWFTVAGITLLATMLVGLSVSARQQVAQTAPCPAKWWLSTPDIQERCGRAKEATDEAYNREQSTQAALRPSLTPLGPQPSTPTAGSFDPAAVPTFGPEDPIEFADGPSNTRGSNSVWSIGILPTGFTGRYSYLYVLARPPRDGRNATLSTALFGNNASENEHALYDRGWMSPQDVGIITITNVTGPTTSANGPTGIVYFTTQGGGTGNFNLTTQTWTFNP